MGKMNGRNETVEELMTKSRTKLKKGKKTRLERCKDRKDGEPFTLKNITEEFRTIKEGGA